MEGDHKERHTALMHLVLKKKALESIESLATGLFSGLRHRDHLLVTVLAELGADVTTYQSGYYSRPSLGPCGAMPSPVLSYLWLT